MDSCLSWTLLAIAIGTTGVARAWALDGPAPRPDRPGDREPEGRKHRRSPRRGQQGSAGWQERATAGVATIDRSAGERKDGQVRLAVLDTLISLGPEAAPAVPALLETLRTDVGGRGEEAAHQDYRSALALAGIGKPAVEGLVGLLKHKKEGVRAEVVMSLGRIGPDAAPAVAELIPLLGDKNERIGREAAVALGHIGTAAIDPLIAASAAPDVTVRKRAVLSLGHLSAPMKRPNRRYSSARLTRRRRSGRRLSSRLSGCGLADDILLPVVKENLRNADEDVRLAVVNLLVPRRTLLRRMAPDLQALLTAKEDGVARHAAFLLGKSGPMAAPLLLSALHEKSSRIDPIAEALARIGRPFVDALAKAIQDPDPRFAAERPWHSDRFVLFQAASPRS